MNKEAQQIIEIADKLRSGEIEHKDARINLCKLFGLEYKTRYTGRAIVNNKKSIYHGIDIPELKIIGLYMTHENGNEMGIYPDGSREFILSLEGTKWERDKYTIIHEKELEILELNID